VRIFVVASVVVVVIVVFSHLLLLLVVTSFLPMPICSVWFARALLSSFEHVRFFNQVLLVLQMGGGVGSVVRIMDATAVHRSETWAVHVWN
jgi:hypothetical protein